LKVGSVSMSGSSPGEGLDRGRRPARECVADFPEISSKSLTGFAFSLVAWDQQLLSAEIRLSLLQMSSDQFKNDRNCSLCGSGDVAIEPA
jgi:hypothetical protein